MTCVGTLTATEILFIAYMSESVSLSHSLSVLLFILSMVIGVYYWCCYHDRSRRFVQNNPERAREIREEVKKAGDLV